ncbi:trypsin-like peptidase domain-containing protein [Streptomyces sp. NPDC005727]|uniref:trypsin-like peptidase domain-containing protein n=1 Tax=Streptomyces sp. NPDC005727 TaxID=3157053 RepID=UPI0033C9BF3D
MEFDRRVQVRARRAGDEHTRFGSGYLIAPQLVLTAAHILWDGEAEPPPGTVTVTVCRPDAGTKQFPGTVCWYRQTDILDAALIKVDNGPDVTWEPPASLSDLSMRPPQRWGQLIGTRPHTVSASGYPLMQKPRSGIRLDEQLVGDIPPGTGSLARRYEVSNLRSDNPRGEYLDLNVSPWEGMSGAALLSEGQQGGLLCGVVRADRRASGGNRLTATPASELLRDDEFRALVTAESTWEPVLEPAEPNDLLEPTTRERDLRSPAMLLRADAEAVRFFGRTDEVRMLRQWCEQDAAPFSIRVVTGPGGQGKTRLARRLTDELRREGWVTGHLRSTLRDHTVSEDALKSLETALPFLLIIDYADARPSLVRRIVERLRTTSHRTRILLLARSDGSWRQDGLGAAYADEFLAAARVHALAPLASASGPDTDRAAAFDIAATDLAELLDRLPHIPGRPPAGWRALVPVVRPPRDLAEPGYDSALSVQTAALTTLLQLGAAPVAESGGRPAEVLLRHEQRYWFRAADDCDLGLRDLAREVLQAAVAVATLCGATDEQQAVATLRRGLPISDRRAQYLAAWLSSLYPAGPDQYWGSLEPDRVAEQHACRAVFDPEISLSLAALLADASADQQIQVVTVLARAAGAHHLAGDTAQVRRIEEKLLAAVARAEIHSDTLWHLCPFLLVPNHGLNALAMWHAEEQAAVTRRVAEADGSTGSLARYALALGHLGSELRRVGRIPDGLEATRTSVEIWRALAADDADRTPQYARALSGLGHALRDIGRPAEALAAQRQAVAVLEGLADTSHDALATLASGLEDLAPRLWEAGEHEEAVRALRRAAQIYEDLAASDSDEEFALAMCLANLGARLSHPTTVHEALKFTEKALEIQRRLARTDPGQEEFLGTTFLNYSLQLRTAGRREEALAVAQQAVTIADHRTRIGLAGGRHAPALRLQLGLLQAECGQLREGLETLRTSSATWKEETSDSPEPEVLGPALQVTASGMFDLAGHLFQAGRNQEALEAIEWTADVRRSLAAIDPDTPEPSLAAALSLRACLLVMGKDPAGPGATIEVVKLYERLAEQSPEFIPQLNGALALLAVVLDDIGSHQQASELRRLLAAQTQE